MIDVVYIQHSVHGIDFQQIQREEFDDSPHREFCIHNYVNYYLLHFSGERHIRYYRSKSRTAKVKTE